MTLVKLVSDFFNALRDRAKNPLVGTFLVSWILINWHPVAYFFKSNEEIDVVLDNLIDNYYIGKQVYLIWLPLLSAIAYRIMSHWVFILIDKYSDYGEKPRLARQHDRLKIAEERRLQIAKLALKADKNEAESDLINQLRQENENNGEAIADLNEYSSQLEEKNKRLQEEVNLQITNLDKAKKEQGEIANLSNKLVAEYVQIYTSIRPVLKEKLGCQEKLTLKELQNWLEYLAKENLETLEKLFWIITKIDYSKSSQENYHLLEKKDLRFLKSKSIITREQILTKDEGFFELLNPYGYLVLAYFEYEPKFATRLELIDNINHLKTIAD